jgi:PKD repeat protein
MRRNIRRLPALVAILLAVCAVVGVPANAAAPANDAFTAATSIAALPFSGSVDLSEATTEPSEPFGCASIRGDVWYRLSATTAESIRVTLSTPDSQVWASAYRDDGGGIGGLQPLNTCIYPNQTSVVPVGAGDTVYLQVNRGFSASTLTATLRVELVAPPPNDNFSDAAVVSALPFSDGVDTSGASIEPSEPGLCTPPTSGKTVWYAYTPDAGRTVIATVGAPEPYGLAVYTGSSLAGLTQAACQYGFPLSVRVQAGTTYYFQLGLSGNRGAQLQFNLDVAPPPVAAFFSYPFDPSVFDTVSFSSQSYDPASNALTQSWNFGDGSSADGSFQQHRYAADGDYRVTLTVTTSDGRTAAVSQTIGVRTHDIAVLGLDTPRYGKAGKTAQITVGVGNTHYAESVDVQLFKSVAGGGWQFVGDLVQPVPAMKLKKTTAFSFTYEFTADDAAAGKVAFQAVAVINGPRDANPSDNLVIAPSTIVTR